MRRIALSAALRVSLALCLIMIVIAFSAAAANQAVQTEYITGTVTYIGPITDQYRPVGMKIQIQVEDETAKARTYTVAVVENSRGALTKLYMDLTSNKKVRFLIKKDGQKRFDENLTGWLYPNEMQTIE